MYGPELPSQPVTTNKTQVAGTVWNAIMVLVFIIWFPVGSINSPKTNNSHDVWTTFEVRISWATTTFARMLMA